MYSSYTSYKPALPVPSYDDAFFDREDDPETMPDEQEKASMLQLAEALLNADPELERRGYSVITAKNGEMEKIAMRYSTYDSQLEIVIYKDHIDYTVHRQYGYEVFGVITKCVLVARKTAGYFAYNPDCGEPPYDPLAELQDHLSLYEALTGERLILPRDMPERKPEKKTWWPFGKK